MSALAFNLRTGGPTRRNRKPLTIRSLREINVYACVTGAWPSVIGMCPANPALQIGSLPTGRQEGAQIRKNHLAGKPFDLLRAVSGSV